MPRCFSISIQSEVAWREALRALTEPAIWIAPENSSSFSVSVVLPASGWEMMAKVRRRRVSAAKGEADKRDSGRQRLSWTQSVSANPLLCRLGVASAAYGKRARAGTAGGGRARDRRDQSAQAALSAGRSGRPHQAGPGALLPGRRARCAARRRRPAQRAGAL